MSKRKAKNVVKLGRKWYRKEYLKSDEWKRIRLAVLSKAKFTCEKCGKKANDVHHMDYSCIGKFVRNLSFFLIALCRDCHNLVEKAKELKIIPNPHQRKDVIKLSKEKVNKRIRRQFETTLIDAKLINRIGKIPYEKRKLIFGILGYSFIHPVELFANKISKTQFDKINRIIHFHEQSA